MGKGEGMGKGWGRMWGKITSWRKWRVGMESREGFGEVGEVAVGGGKRGWAEIDNDTARYIFLRDSTLDGSELLQKTSKRNDWGKERLGHKGSRRLGRRLAMISNIEE